MIKDSRAKFNKNLNFDYKNPMVFYEYLEGSKIAPVRNTNLTRKQQRTLGQAIKKARNIGLIPTDYKSYDNFGRWPELISPRPFDYKA